MEQANVIHDVNGKDIESYQAIITSAPCMHDISIATYTSTISNWLTKAFFYPEVQRKRINCRRFPEMNNALLGHLYMSHDHSSYSYPAQSNPQYEATYHESTAIHFVNCYFHWSTSHFLKQQRTDSLSISSFYKSIYQAIFPDSKLADKLKPRITSARDPPFHFI